MLQKLRENLLTIVWLLIAVTILIVTVIYFCAVNDIYDEQYVRIKEAIDYLPDEYSTIVDDNREFQVSQDDAYDKGLIGAEGRDSDGAPEIQPDPVSVSQAPDPTKPMIALTFDDGPSMYTERILDTLKRYGARATFFMVGYNVSKHPERINLVLDAGCEVGNHTSGHEYLTKISSEDVARTVFDNEDLINGTAQLGELIVRPPYGLTDNTVKSVVDRPMINWSLDSRDWKTKDADSTVSEVKKNIKDGYVVLMHDIYESTAEAIEELVPWLIDEGYQLVTVSEMYRARGETLRDGHIYRFTYTAEEYEENRSAVTD